jgi:tellurium resistance protein TerD
MAEVINLRKGDKFSIGFTNITVGLGWEPNEGTGGTFDLDVSAIMLNENRKIPNKDYFVFYGNLNSPDGSVSHSGDDTDGTNSDGGDDESLIIDLTKINPSIKEILFIVTIDGASQKRQNFGQIRDSYIQLTDNNTGNEVMKYELGEDFSIETGIEFGRLYIRNNEWKFDASGVGYKEDLAFFLGKYFSGTINK